MAGAVLYVHSGRTLVVSGVEVLVSDLGEEYKVPLGSHFNAWVGAWQW